ncbi:solute carrier family 35 member E4 [Striga asiatica]|uniref:Solute carrier family 35 member E4 n=1 Tax=Striga asiatica TaxID=4170 RepID=A0A5A7QFE2_STRAF|nr:solute carrier family 35 member E4 [Striga asiatica]
MQEKIYLTWTFVEFELIFFGKPLSIPYSAKKLDDFGGTTWPAREPPELVSVGALGDKEASGVTVLGAAVSFGTSFRELPFGSSLKLISENPLGFDDCEATGEEGKPASSALLLATSFDSNCRYNSAALEFKNSLSRMKTTSRDQAT